MAYSELIKNFNKVCDHMKFHQTSDGKNVFLSIDSRVTRHDPLYKACR